MCLSEFETKLNSHVNELTVKKLKQEMALNQANVFSQSSAIIF